LQLLQGFVEETIEVACKDGSIAIHKPEVIKEAIVCLLTSMSGGSLRLDPKSIKYDETKRIFSVHGAELLKVGLLAEHSIFGSRREFRVFGRRFEYYRPAPTISKTVRFLLAAIFENAALDALSYSEKLSIGKSNCLLRRIGALFFVKYVRQCLSPLRALPESSIHRIIGIMNAEIGSAMASTQFSNARNCLVEAAKDVTDLGSVNYADIPLNQDYVALLVAIEGHLSAGHLLVEPLFRYMLMCLQKQQIQFKADLSVMSPLEAIYISEVKSDLFLQAFESCRRETEAEPTFGNCFKLLVCDCFLSHFLNAETNDFESSVVADLYALGEQLEVEGFPVQQYGAGIDDIMVAVGSPHIAYSRCYELMQFVQPLSMHSLELRLKFAVGLISGGKDAIVCIGPASRQPDNLEGRTTPRVSTPAYLLGNPGEPAASDAESENPFDEKSVDLLPSAEDMLVLDSSSKVCLLVIDTDCLSVEGVALDSFNRAYEADNVWSVQFDSAEVRNGNFNAVLRSNNFVSERLNTTETDGGIVYVISKRVAVQIKRQINENLGFVKSKLLSEQTTDTLSPGLSERIVQSILQIEGCDSFNCFKTLAKCAMMEIENVIAAAYLGRNTDLNRLLNKFAQKDVCLLVEDEHRSLPDSLRTSLLALHDTEVVRCQTGSRRKSLQQRNPFESGRNAAVSVQADLLENLCGLHSSDVNCGQVANIVICHMCLLASVFQGDQNGTHPFALGPDDRYFCSLSDLLLRGCEFYETTFLFKEFEARLDSRNFKDCFSILEKLDEMAKYWSQMDLSRCELLKACVSRWSTNFETTKLVMLSFMSAETGKAEQAVDSFFDTGTETGDISFLDLLRGLTSCTNSDTESLQHAYHQRQEHLRILGKTLEVVDRLGLVSNAMITIFGNLDVVGRLDRIRSQFERKVNDLTERVSFHSVQGLAALVVLDSLYAEEATRHLECVNAAMDLVTERLRGFYTENLDNVKRSLAKGFVDIGIRDFVDCINSVIFVSTQLNTVCAGSKLLRLVPDIVLAHGKIANSLNEICARVSSSVRHSADKTFCDDKNLLNNSQFINDLIGDISSSHLGLAATTENARAAVQEFCSLTVSRMDKLITKTLPPAGSDVAVSAVAVSTPDFVEVCALLDWLASRLDFQTASFERLRGSCERLSQVIQNFQDSQIENVKVWFEAVAASTSRNAVVVDTDLAAKKLQLLSTMQSLNQYMVDYLAHKEIFIDCSGEGFKIFQKAYEQRALSLTQFIWNKRLLPAYNSLLGYGPKSLRMVLQALNNQQAVPVEVPSISIRIWTRIVEDFIDITAYFCLDADRTAFTTTLRNTHRQILQLATSLRTQELQQVTLLLASNQFQQLAAVLQPRTQSEENWKEAMQLVADANGSLLKRLHAITENCRVCETDIISAVKTSLHSDKLWSSFDDFIDGCCDIIAFQGSLGEFVALPVTSMDTLLEQLWTEHMATQLDRVVELAFKCLRSREFGKACEIISALKRTDQLLEGRLPQFESVALRNIQDRWSATVSEVYDQLKEEINRALDELWDDARNWKEYIRQSLRNYQVSGTSASNEGQPRILSCILCNRFRDHKSSGLYTVLSAEWYSLEYPIDNFCFDLKPDIFGPVQELFDSESFDKELSEEISSALLQLLDCLPLSQHDVLDALIYDLTELLEKVDKERTNSESAEVDAYKFLYDMRESMAVHLVLSRSDDGSPRRANSGSVMSLAEILTMLTDRWRAWNRHIRFPKSAAEFLSFNSDEEDLKSLAASVLLPLARIMLRLLKALDGKAIAASSEDALYFVGQYWEALCSLIIAFGEPNEFDNMDFNQNSFAAAFNIAVEVVDSQEKEAGAVVAVTDPRQRMALRRDQSSYGLSERVMKAKSKLIQIFSDRYKSLQITLEHLEDASQVMAATEIASSLGIVRQLLVASAEYDEIHHDMCAKLRPKRSHLGSYSPEYSLDRISICFSAASLEDDASSVPSVCSLENEEDKRCSYKTMKALFNEYVTGWMRVLSADNILAKASEQVSPQQWQASFRSLIQHWMALFVVTIDGGLHKFLAPECRVSALDNILCISSECIEAYYMAIRDLMKGALETIQMRFEGWLAPEGNQQSSMSYDSSGLNYDSLFAQINRLRIIARSITELGLSNLVNPRENSKEFQTFSQISENIKSELQCVIRDGVIEVIYSHFRSCLSALPDQVEKAKVISARCLVEYRHLGEQYLNNDEFHPLLSFKTNALFEDMESAAGAQYMVLLRSIYDYLALSVVSLRLGVGDGIRCADEFNHVFGRFAQEWRNEKYLLKGDDVIDMLRIQNVSDLVELTSVPAEADEFAAAKEKYKMYLTAFGYEYQKLCMEGRSNPFDTRTKIIRDAKHMASHYLLFGPSENETEEGAAFEICFYLIVRIFAMWTLLYSGKVARIASPSAIETSHMKDLKPHDGQVVSLLVLFDGIQIQRPDKYHPAIVQVCNQFIQIGTGQGKSVTLAVASLVLALLGMNVDCICYSPYLSDRDHENFMDLFMEFGMKDFIFYDTYENQCETYVREKTASLGGNVSEVIRHLFDNNQLPPDRYKKRYYRDKIKEAVLRERDKLLGGRGFLFCARDILQRKRELFSADRPRHRVLLLDEVDKFFSQNFIDKQFRINTYLTPSEAIGELFLLLWKERNNPLYQTLEQVQCTDIYGQCEAAYAFSGWKLILPQAVAAMLIDRKCFKSHPYKVDNMQIAYLLSGADAYSTDVRYR
jgi:hypothetical protein